MTDNPLRKALEDNRRAAKAAFGSARRSAARPTDPELMLYNQLKTEHFERLREIWGADVITSYIRSMEFKKARKNG